MDLATIFMFINFSVLPAWAMLIFLPRWSGTKMFVHSLLYPCVLGVLYTVGLGFAVFGGMGATDGSFTSLAGVKALFSADISVLIGWAHYLVFDLFVGAWMARDAQRSGVHHGLLIPCLLFTFMAGPLGLLLYVCLRAIRQKGGWSLSEG